MKRCWSAGFLLLSAIWLVQKKRLPNRRAKSNTKISWSTAPIQKYRKNVAVYSVHTSSKLSRVNCFWRTSNDIFNLSFLHTSIYFVSYFMQPLNICWFFSTLVHTYNPAIDRRQRWRLRRRNETINLIVSSSLIHPYIHKHFLFFFLPRAFSYRIPVGATRSSSCLCVLFTAAVYHSIHMTHVVVVSFLQIATNLMPTFPRDR